MVAKGISTSIGGHIMKRNPTQKKFKKKEPNNPPFSGRMCRIYVGSPMSKPII